MSMQRAMKRSNHGRVTAAVLALALTTGCAPSGVQGKADSPRADSVLATTDSSGSGEKWCGPKDTNEGQDGFSGKDCEGQLPPNWKNWTGGEFADKVGPLVNTLGFGRMRPRAPASGLDRQPLVFVGPTSDAHTLRPDKITQDVVFGLMLVYGNATKKFKMRPRSQSFFWMILHPSPQDKDNARWSLVHLYLNGQTWEKEIVFEDGVWKTCPKQHDPWKYAYADFSGCPARFQNELRPDMPFSSFLELTDRIWNQEAKAAATAEETGIWIFCNIGCCEANHAS